MVSATEIFGFLTISADSDQWDETTKSLLVESVINLSIPAFLKSFLRTASNATK